MKSKNFKKLLSKTLIVLVLALGFATVGLGSHVKLAAAACSVTPNSSLGTDSMTMSVPTTATYNVWVRMLTPNSANNSIYMQIDGGCATNVGGSTTIAANTWTWVNYQNGSTSSTISASLTSGTHTVLLTGNSQDVGVDSVLFLDSSCNPNNTTCTTVSAPTVSITSPGTGATVSGSSVSLAANATDTGTVSSVQFKVDSTVVATLTNPSSGTAYSTTWNSSSVSNGAHSLTVTATDTANLTTSQTENFTVNNTVACTGNPSTPTLTAAANGINGVTLNWTASTPATGCTLNGYTLYRGTPGASTQIAALDSTIKTFPDTGLQPNTSYSYYVVAADAAGHDSADSNVASATTSPVTTPPSAPTNVTDAAPTDAAVNLKWTASTDSLASVAGYRVYRNGSLYASVSGASNTSYPDTNVQPSTSYTYTVSALDTFGNESAQTSATPSPITTPAALQDKAPTTPTNFSASMITTDSVTLSWTASTDSVGTLAGYKIFEQGVTNPFTTTGTSDTIGGLNAGTPYSFTVEAYNTAQQTSQPTAALSVTTESGPVPTSNGDIYPIPNGDKLIDYQDLSQMLAHWGQSCTSVTSPTVPYCGNLVGGTGPSAVVGAPDLTQMLNNWSTAVTNPVTPSKTYNSLYTKPNAFSCLETNSSFTVAVDEYSGSTPTNAVEDWVSYDPTYLSLISASYTGSSFGIGALSAPYYDSSNNTAGIYIVRGTTSTTLTGDQNIATLTFNTKKSVGNADIYTRWHAIGIATAANSNNLAPETYGSSVSIGSASGKAGTCSSTNSSSHVVQLPFPGTTSTVSQRNTNVTVGTSDTTNTNVLPATTATAANATTVATINVTPSGTTTAVPVAANSPWQLSTTAKLNPGTSTTGNYSNVSYYLNGKLLANETGSDFAYTLDAANFRNGSYKLVTTEILSSGIKKTITTDLNIKNAASLKQLYLQTGQYIWLLIAIIVVLIIGGYTQKSLTKKHPKWSQPIVDPDVRGKSDSDK